MRDCLVTNHVTHKILPAKFHMWTHESWVVEPSPLVGGAPGGQVTRLLGLVEYEDGSCELVHPSHIRFVEGYPDEKALKEGTDE